MLDLADNAFQGPFPMFLVTQAAAVQAACSSECTVSVYLYGLELQCPNEVQLTQQQLQYLQDAHATYECVNSTGNKVCVCLQ